MELKEGIYERLIDGHTAKAITRAKEAGMHCQQDEIDSAEADQLLADYAAGALHKLLEADDSPTMEKIARVNELLRHAGIQEEFLLEEAPRLLSSVLSPERRAQLKVTKQALVRPQSGFRDSVLFTGGPSTGLSLSSELLRDIASADEICIIVSFLRLSGLRLLLDALREFCSDPRHRLRIITTTYCGITEARALEQLAQLERTEIRISYDTKIERLHAKAYLFLRDSGYSTAYIGSSNLSHSAHTDGLEWNVRATQVENPQIIKSALATFERYWASDHFEDFREGGIEKFRKELHLEKQATTSRAAVLFQPYHLLPHQKTILDTLKVERLEGQLYRNLVVAATGTGKTVISAFDYKCYREAHPQAARLLFVAHREELLRQALYTYRSVLCDPNFGELWVGTHRPQHSLDHLFLSVATLHSNKDSILAQGANYYHYLVIDEAHHTAADSYRLLVEQLQPQILLGLTATPERMDGKSLLPDFGGKISAEIRLAKALDEGLLTPFQYFCISDSVDLSDESLWKNGGYDTSRLSAKLRDAGRLGLIIGKLKQYLPDEKDCRTLCFCCDKEHALFMAHGLQEAGLKTAVLTSDTPSSERKHLAKDLAEKRINYLCCVDIFNEGVDIPEVDTALFLRPTNSLTIFLQQLGRGLRISAGKDYLTVLDFVAQANNKYDFTSRFRSLCLRPDRDIKKQIHDGFTTLPQGCSIRMERVAREYILSNIQNAIYTKRRLVQELQGYPSIPTLSEFIAGNGQDIRLLYRAGYCWTTLKRDAGKCPSFKETKLTKLLVKGIKGLIHINSSSFLHAIQSYLRTGKFFNPTPGLSPQERVRQEHFKLMLYYNLFREEPCKLGYASVEEALSELRSHPLFKQEVLELTDYLLSELPFMTAPITPDLPLGLELHGSYTREEVFILFGRQTETKRMQGTMGGVFSIEERNLELLFVTLNKSDKDFSPSTQYDDYFISERLFHWQSPNTLAHDNRGKRYLQRGKKPRHFILFVRERKMDDYRNTSTFLCLGFANYRSSYGDFPMSIQWELQEPAPAHLLRPV